ncbi:uncharacterized protein LOC122672758 [Telopea speciosissima]|uniref:uncharacterized protein LOC122672758 n=1 Tax=Telopea speciosissima TaxID=54955 RepID=UPI001CC79C7F|nr:uncharacterized protein LOC122672758 [Telopea speciosissima]
MDRSRSSGASWADQWDYNAPAYQSSNTSNGSGGMSSNKYGKKVGEGLEKTKAVASTGFRKVKAGTSVGFHWIKDKYQKTTQKN